MLTDPPSPNLEPTNVLYSTLKLKKQPYEQTILISSVIESALSIALFYAYATD